jgi:hypothetical protein
MEVGKVGVGMGLVGGQSMVVRVLLLEGGRRKIMKSGSLWV